MRYILLLLITIPFFFTACREDEGPSDCETFKNTKGEIQLWQPAGQKETILVQAEGNNVIAGTVVFKLNKQYDEVKWLINNDSNYNYTTKEVSLRFSNPLRTYTVTAIGTKYFSSKQCGSIKLIDTLNTSFRTHRVVSATGLLGKKFEIESTQYPGEKWTFHFENVNGPINDFIDFFSNGSDYPAIKFPDRSDVGIDPPYLIAVNFPRFRNDSFMIKTIYTDNYTYVEGFITIWDSTQRTSDYKYGISADLFLYRNIENNEVSGRYSYFVKDSVTGFNTKKMASFKGIAK